MTDTDVSTLAAATGAVSEDRSDRAAANSGSVWFGGLAAAAAWLIASLVTTSRPDVGEWSRTDEFSIALMVIAATLAVAAAAARWLEPVATRLRSGAPWLIVIPLAIAAWEAVTANFPVLPQPFFPPPQALIEVYTDDWQRLGTSVLHSLRLLGVGYLLGAATGFLLGVSLGWSRAVGYWVHPVLRLVGPLPATAWLPLAFFAFPSSWSASIFLIALATCFPVTILTWSGVAGVSGAYYDVARTLGANGRFLVLKVAIPAALPHVFVGLFMGLGASFAMLVVAEMLGVKAGLGWYLQWAQGWASYANMYAALLVMALMCSGLITLLFRVRDHLLAWQRGLVRW